MAGPDINAAAATAGHPAEPAPRTAAGGADPAGGTQYDVAVLGSGLAGSTMAACLAANGASVIVADAGTHPRFAIGESTIPYTSMLLRLVSERYRVPELKWLTTFENVQGKITSNCGVKRNFGFIYHREGQPQNPAESHEFPIPKITHTENHFFRQDIDTWMVNVAAKHGAVIRQRCLIEDVHIDESGVRLDVAGGPPIFAKFIVDASGFRSPLATKFGLREDPPRLRTHSRALFTHMIGVKPYEKTVAGARQGNPSPWSEGTLHHLFDGGWMWIIPFDNHVRATNPLCSVGINLDPRVHPVPDCTPEEEFNRFLAKFPDIAPQFEGARPVRDWIRTPRLQYSSTQTVGYRWCLTSHAAGFVDALFSRGLSNTMEIVNALGWRLLDALRDDDFSVDRFAYVQELEQGLLDFNDDLVASAYTSFADYSLWDAWFRIWSLGQILATFEINRSYARFLDGHDPRVLEHLESIAPSGGIPDYPPARDLLKQVTNLTAAVQSAGADPRETAGKIMELLRVADFAPPAFGLQDPGNRWINATTGKVLRTLYWARRQAPPPIGELVYDGLVLFIKKRFARDEFDLTEEAKHIIARWPLVGRPLRVPAPK